MKRAILGTAGHIDHGKTELIRALTGIDTDRLKEEKQRGISIELGFAHLDLRDDLKLGIVDVPGHERFVRQMVAGSGGIDMAALVIALDEGVMPQTVEHLDILRLLGIKNGLVVLTKLDLVDEELAELAQEDARELVTGTFLEEAPMIRVSSKTEEGIDDLREALVLLASQVEERPVQGLPRLPVDRVFTIKGHGTVVTGTLISGTLSTGDEVEILPGGLKSSVRSLQSHNQKEERAYPGERIAVNLRGVEQSQIHRGEIVTHPDEFRSSYIVDIQLNSLKRSPITLKNRQKVRLHHYTTEVEARLVFPGMESLVSGQSTLAQLRTSAPIVPSTGDRFVIRALSPSITLGGGVILNPRGVKLRTRNVDSFMQLEGEDEEGLVAALIRSGGMDGVGRNELLGLSGLSVKRLDKILDSLRNAHTVVRFDPSENIMIHKDLFEVLTRRISERLESFHRDHPLKEAMPKQELRSTLPGGDKLFKKGLANLESKKLVVDNGDSVRSATHKVELKEDEKGLKDLVLQLITKPNNSPPVLKEVIAETGGNPKQIRSLLDILAKEGKIVRIKEDLYFASQFIEETKNKLADFIKKQGGVTPSQFGEVTGSSRKYNIPLLEYFDRERFTIRVGNQRVLRGSGNSGGGGNAA
jgi:selenocysteine-specific elongation factor